MKKETSNKFFPHLVLNVFSNFSFFPIKLAAFNLQSNQFLKSAEAEIGNHQVKYKCLLQAVVLDSL